ncbi:unnamed protein product [Taenia asiatica]|uniref:DUF4210 domain-containing protein n=1 Tax=Taenia asiatica TaxID=60517 RepID=A0A0R3W8F5_TAEAS|nr:unnamed protein product [Taenia asiatica]
MPLDVNNNATSGITTPQPQRRSLILIPLGPAEEPPVFNLALNLNGARNSFLTGIDEWAMKRPTNCRLIHRLVDCCKANLEMVPLTCDSFSKPVLMDQIKWFGEIFAMLLPIEVNDSAILHLACVRQQVRSNGRHVRLIILFSYIDEMLSSMLCSHDVTKEVLTPCCKAYVTLLCLVAALTPPRKLALELIQPTQQPSSATSQVHLPQNQQVGFGASVAVTPVKMSESMRELRVYQETFCHWSKATVQFEHTAIFYTSRAKSAALKRHALEVRTHRNSDLIHQSFEYMMQQKPKPRSQQNQLQVPASLSLLTPTRPAPLLSVNSVSDIIFEEDRESIGSDKMSADSDSEASQNQQEEQQMEEEEGEERGLENSDESTIWDTTCNDKETVDGTVNDATCDVDGGCISRKEGILLISAFLTGIDEDAYLVRTRSPSRLQSGTPTKASFIHGSQTCASSSADNAEKEMREEEGEEEMLPTREEPLEKTSDLFDTEISYIGSMSQTVSEMRRSTTPRRPFTLSIVLRTSDDKGGMEGNIDDEKSEARMGRSENPRSTSFELTTVGAFKLSDGSPIQIMISGGSVMAHKQTLLDIQRYLLHEKASTFSASDKIRKYLEGTGTSRFTVRTLFGREDEERGGTGGVVRRSGSQTRGPSAMSLMESEISTRASKLKESRRTCTFRVSEGAPLKLKELRQSQCKRRKTMWEKHRHYVREEAGSFLEGCRCRPIVVVDDEADCCAVVHQNGRERSTTVGHFSLRQDAPSRVTTICHSCFKRRQNMWSKQRSLLCEEAETFLAQKLVLREGKQSASLLSLPHPLPSLTAPASVETIDIGPARILVTSNRREDGGLVAHIITEFPLDPAPPSDPRNLQLVFDVAMPEESI